MSESPFDYNPHVQEILKNILKSDTAEEAQEAFLIVETLDEKTRGYIADKLEEIVINMLGMDDETAGESIEELKNLAEQLEDARAGHWEQFISIQQEEDLDGFMIGSQLIDFVYKTKGNQSHSFFKLYIKEMAEFTEEEWTLPENHIKATYEALEKLYTLPPIPKLPVIPFKNIPPKM